MLSRFLTLEYLSRCVFTVPSYTWCEYIYQQLYRVKRQNDFRTIDVLDSIFYHVIVFITIFQQHIDSSTRLRSNEKQRACGQNDSSSLILESHVQERARDLLSAEWCRTCLEPYSCGRIVWCTILTYFQGGIPLSIVFILECHITLQCY